MIRKKHVFTGLVVTICCLVFAGGCATGPSGTGKAPSELYAPSTKALEGYSYAGFLSDYSKLEPAADVKGAMLWISPDIDFSAFDKVLLERLKFSFKENTEHKVIDPTELKALADYFHEAFVKALGEDYPLVDAPGPGVLRVRAAVTEIIPNKPDYSVVALVVPYVSYADIVASTASKGGAGSSFYVGDTVVEAELMDSRTNVQLSAFVQRYFPKKYDVDLSKGAGTAVTHGFGQYFKAYSTWSYTRDAMDHWAEMLRDRLDQAHGKTAKN